MKREATWLTTRGQAQWMVNAGLLENFEVIEANVMQRLSHQCPSGYEVCRVKGVVLSDDSRFVGPRYYQGDEPLVSGGKGYKDQGYHNDWRWVD